MGSLIVTHVPYSYKMVIVGETGYRGYRTFIIFV